MTYLKSSYLFFLLVGIVLLGGCKREDDHRIRITMWHQDRPDVREVLQRQLDRFMQLHPEVRVEQLFKETEELRSGFIVASIAGQGPEIVYGPSDQVGPFQVMDIILPLEDLFEKEFLDRFNPRGLTYYKGHLYQIADKLGNHLTLVYNKKYIQQPPSTEKELIAIGTAFMNMAIKRGEKGVYGLSWNYTEPFFFIPFLTGYNGWIMDLDGNPTLNTTAMVKGLQFIKTLRDSFQLIPNESDYNIADVLFKDGKSAMIINGDWSWAGYQKAGLDIGVSPLPKMSETGTWCGTMVSPKGFSINANISAEKKKWVIELIKYLNSDENQLESTQALYTVPTLKSVQQSEFVQTNEILRNSQIQIEHGQPMPVDPELRAIWDAMRPSYQAVLAGTKTPEQAASDMQIQALQRIKEMNE